MTLLSASTLSTASYISSLPLNAQDLFNESMIWMDSFYDPPAGYLFDESAATALRHETRSSAWYAIGLLARNNGTDVKEACKILANVCSAQYKDPRAQWLEFHRQCFIPGCPKTAGNKMEIANKIRYGDYQQEPEEPTVGTAAYPQKIYNSWDPNWRGFIGTTLIMGLEEFSHFMPNSLVKLIEASLYNATVGDSYRVGGVDDDNLYPAYTNPV